MTNSKSHRPAGGVGPSGLWEGRNRVVTWLLMVESNGSSLQCFLHKETTSSATLCHLLQDSKFTRKSMGLVQREPHAHSWMNPGWEWSIFSLVVQVYILDSHLNSGPWTKWISTRKINSVTRGRGRDSMKACLINPHYNIQHGTYLYFILLFICPVCMLICRARVDTALNKVPMSICK